MSIKIHVDNESRLRVTMFAGTLDDDLLVNFYKGAQEGFDPHLNSLLDFSAVDEVKVTAGGMREVERLFRAEHLVAERKVALVAPSDVLYGMARMYEILHQESVEKVRVFRDGAEARDWVTSAED